MSTPQISIELHGEYVEYRVTFQGHHAEMWSKVSAIEQLFEDGLLHVQFLGVFSSLLRDVMWDWCKA